MSLQTAFALHFDSLNATKTGLRFPKDPKDPTFQKAAIRLLDIAERLNIKYTVFVIGDDLRLPENVDTILEFAKKGHEIANHSYTHKINLGYLSEDTIKAEIDRTHEAILKICGKEPKGFAAPNWSGSNRLLKILAQKHYLYDASFFPSYFIWMLLFKVLLKTYKNPGACKDLFQRKDWLINLAGKTGVGFCPPRDRIILRKQGRGVLGKDKRRKKNTKGTSGD